jgi:protein tyrosine phosphatase (PTP) superfamily phosphohydrolase (DUF442 family)
MNYSFITPDLFVGTTPSVDDYQRLRELGVRLVINMRREQGPAPDPHAEPLSLLWLRTFDNPFFPIPLSALLHGAQTALQAIAEGGKVYAHCAYGRHRGAAMGACILIAQGYDPRAAMNLVKEQRPISDPHIFYIRSRIVKFAGHWAQQAAAI